MKMKPEHYEQLEQAMQRIQLERPGQTIESYEAWNLPPMRFRWDMLAAAIRKGYFRIGDGAGMPGCPLYSYLNDSHIDTALRRITGTL